MRKFLSLSILFFLFATGFTNAQIYMKLAGPTGIIKGEATAESYMDQIDIMAYSSSIAGCPAVNNGPGASGGGGACKAIVSHLQVIVLLNRGVIPMKQLILTGKILPYLELSFTRNNGDSGPEEYYKIRMEDVIISSMQESANDDQRPTFSVQFGSKKIAWAYRIQNRDGSMGQYQSAGWDLSANKPWTYNFPNAGGTQ